ncbi:MAG TPA: ABC transporter ATP-binding protein [Mycobacteriales bacterium]|nr:ABC transporter ATP-binding protein [Mycobacteriales bacterium]
MSEVALRAHRVVKRFGGHLALDDVSLDLAAGQVHAVIGPNGAGKSTLFGVIAGEHRPERGRVWLAGRDVTRASPRARVRLGLARAFQVARVFGEMTVRDNITSAVLASAGGTLAFWRGVPDRHAGRVDEALERVRLADQQAKLARELSQGDRKRLEIGMALALDPSVLLLDEPTAGMSPTETEATVELIRQLWRATGMAILLTEHDMKVVFDLAQQLTVLHYGRVLCTGEPEQVRRRDDVIEVYLGGRGG